MHPGKLYYVPGVGVDLKRFAGSREEGRKLLGIPEDEFVLLSVGELSIRKNHRLALEALAKLRDIPFRYVLVGRGEKLEQLKALAEELQIADRVMFTGYRNDVAKIFPAADVFFFPSIQEGLPVALMESMCAGIPAIVGKIRGNTDLIEGEKEGLYMDLTPDSAAAAIRRLYENPALRTRLAEAAKEKVKQFEASSVQKQVREIYNQTLEGADGAL